MKFSVCIPNFNYAQYIGETLDSVLAQDADFEVIVADNASTDESVAVVEARDDPRIRLLRNRWNVGFAGNLDRASRHATGDRMILLSSDDLAEPEALATYARLADALGERSERAIFASAQHVVDGEGTRTGATDLEARLWEGAREDAALSAAVGQRVLRADASMLLRTSLKALRTPFAFATTCYPRGLYEALEGYGGGPLINPDKWFAWRLLSIADEAFFVEAPLFSYRVHANNQGAIQQKSGALKHLMDQYRATFDLEPSVLDAAGLDRDALAAAFIEEDIGLRGLAMVADGNRALARRGLAFGTAAYPALVRRSRSVALLRVALALGPAGSAIAKRRRRSALARYRATPIQRDLG